MVCVNMKTSKVFADRNLCNLYITCAIKDLQFEDSTGAAFNTLWTLSFIPFIICIFNYSINDNKI